MNFGASPQGASGADRADRRLLGGLLVSLLLHGMVLLLQFGVPGMGTSGSAPPLTVRIANADPASVTAPPEVLLPPPAVTTAAPVTGGMRLVNPAPAPEPSPPAKAKPKVKQDQPRRARRISSPLPVPETLEEPTKVIAQDVTVNEFAVPIVRPEESEQKTVDIKDAQAGDDDGDAETSAALQAEAAKAGRLKADEEAKAARLAEEEARVRAAESARQAAEREKQRQALEQDARKLGETQQRAEQLKQEQQRQQQLATEQRRAEQLKVGLQNAEQLRMEQQRAEQQRVAQQKVEQQRVEQQKVEQQRVAQQQVEQQVEQQKVEQQKAEQLRVEQQKVEQLQGEQQKAEQQRAEQQRAERQASQSAGRDRDALQPGGAGAGGRNAGPGGAGATGQIPRNMLGSDLANRARDLVKGIDVLSGDPPGVRSREGRRVAVGANERDLPLRMYVESWRQKIERNASVNFPRNWVDEEKKDALVSVAVRSDGTVEDVTIITSSGRADMDEAVRRIVRVNARYSPFPPAIAQKYDVIDIRRVWRFGEMLKLMEEVR